MCLNTKDIRSSLASGGHPDRSGRSSAVRDHGRGYDPRRSTYIYKYIYIYIYICIRTYYVRTVPRTCSFNVVRRGTYHVSTAIDYGCSPATYLFPYTGALMDVDTGWYSPYVAQPDHVAWFRWEGCDETWAQWKVFVHRRRRYLSRACTRIASYAYLICFTHA